MAETGKQNGKAPGAEIPVTPAPTRSQTNLASRAPEGAEAGKEGSGAATTDVRPPPELEPAGDRPPPEEPGYGRRRGDNAWMIPGEPPQTQTGGEFSSAAEQAGHRQVGGVASRIALMVICAMSGSIEYHPTAEDSAVVSVETSVAGSGAVGEGRSEATGALPEDPDQALTTALDDLNTALEGIPGRSPEEILHELSVPGQGCMIAWTNHLPSLLYGKEPIGPNSLAYTVEGCAKAVSRLH